LITLNIRIGRKDEAFKDDKSFNLSFHLYNNSGTSSTLIGVCNIPIQLRSHKWNGKFITGTLVPIISEDSIPMAELVELTSNSNAEVTNRESMVTDLKAEQQTIETLLTWKQNETNSEPQEVRHQNSQNKQSSNKDIPFHQQVKDKKSNFFSTKQRKFPLFSTIYFLSSNSIYAISYNYTRKSAIPSNRNQDK